MPRAPLLLLLPLLLAAQCCAARPPLGDHNFRYERLQNYGLGRRVIPEYWRLERAHAQAHAQPLRTAPARYLRPPYRNLYQGVRRGSDRRVYMKKFNFAPKPTGHSVFCQAIVACKISHVAVETEAGAPLLLRGGAGHRHLQVLVKARAGVALRGALAAYCRAPPPARE